MKMFRTYADLSLEIWAKLLGKVTKNQVRGKKRPPTYRVSYISDFEGQYPTFSCNKNHLIYTRVTP